MKVSELIEVLQGYDGNLPVKVLDGEYYEYDLVVFAKQTDDFIEIGVHYDS